MSDIIDKLETPEECEQLIKNVQDRKPELAIRARLKKIDLLASKHAAKSDVEKDIIKAMYAYEEVLTAKHGKKTRASRTWPMFERHGTITAVEKIVERPQETSGYKLTVEKGLQDISFEAVVLRYPTHFSQKAVAIAKERLKDWTSKSPQGPT